MNETSGEKVFDPTPKRRRDAALKGDVLRSRELATAATVLAGLAWLAFAGPWLVEELEALLVVGLTFDAGALESTFGQAALGRIPHVFAPVVVLGLLVPAASLVAQLAFGEGRFVIENLAFKGNRINPINGLKRMFGPQGWIEMGKGLLKVALLGAIFAMWAWFARDDFAQIGRATLDRQLQLAWQAGLGLLGALGIGLAIIAALDLPLQWQQLMKRLRMSHQDMREEMKEAEGSPEARAARRQRQRDIATGALAPAMREAQFVITNPAHFAVALMYDPARAPAPLVVAKGRGEKAMAIRELAAERRLPVLEYPPLARSLYFTTRERQMIAEELYGAVAAIVAFVLSIRRGENPPRPLISVPLTLRFDAQGNREA